VDLEFVPGRANPVRGRPEFVVGRTLGSVPGAEMPEGLRAMEVPGLRLG
jgi:hypothetical protein